MLSFADLYYTEDENEFQARDRPSIARDAPTGPAGAADALSRVTGPGMGEWRNRDTGRYAGPAGFRIVASEESLGGAVRTLLLEKGLPAGRTTADRGRDSSGRGPAAGERQTRESTAEESR